MLTRIFTPAAKPLGTVLVIAVLLQACTKDDQLHPLDRVDAMPYEKLSDYGLFSGPLNQLQPAPGVIPYDLNTPLFSDYAGKARFIYIPSGGKATYRENEVFDFPPGTILVKTFYFDNDQRDPEAGRKIYETRLLIHKKTGWEAENYLWNESQTEAFHYVAGKTIPVSWIHADGTLRTTMYHIPNKNECKGCHNKNDMVVPIGPKARNINKNYNYADGPRNQIEEWTRLGLLTGTPPLADVPKVPVWNDASSGSLNDRARAYLDVNCAHCHTANGPANSSGLFLDYTEHNPTALGICKPPLAAGQGSGGLKYSIVPGKPEASIFIYRMNSTQPDVAMPELGRSLVHEEAVRLISDWIASLPPAGCE